eukprot:386500_1
MSEDQTKEQLIKTYYDLRYKYSTMKYMQEVISFEFQNEIKQTQKLLMSEFGMNDQIDLAKIRQNASYDAKRGLLVNKVVINMELPTYFHCLTYGYIRISFEKTWLKYIPDDIKNICFLFCGTYIRYNNSNCKAKIINNCDAKTTKLLIKTSDNALNTNTSCAVATSFPINATDNKWQIKLKLFNDNAYSFGIVSDIYQFMNSSQQMLFEEKNIRKGIYWANENMNIIENGSITIDDTVDWLSWESSVSICFESNKLTIRDVSDTYVKSISNYNDDGTVKIYYYFAMILTKGMQYEMLIYGDDIDFCFPDSDDESSIGEFWDIDDAIDAERLREFEYKIGHRPSTQELMDKNILYRSVENMASAIQNVAKYLEETGLKYRSSRDELVSKGYIRT